MKKYLLYRDTLCPLLTDYIVSLIYLGWQRLACTQDYAETKINQYMYLFLANKPTFAEIAEWRKILHRLSFFLRSVDYLILELLRRLVLTATRDLTRFVTQSFQNGMGADSSDEVNMFGLYIQYIFFVLTILIWVIIKLKNFLHNVIFERLLLFLCIIIVYCYVLTLFIA